MRYAPMSLVGALIYATIANAAAESFTIDPDHTYPSFEADPSRTSDGPPNLAG